MDIGCLYKKAKENRISNTHDILNEVNEQPVSTIMDPKQCM